ncbi:MAG: galactokinase [Fimbriimonadaceae bacterium]|nr:galactokinase [Fimbriimonadaceae bacterium]
MSREAVVELFERRFGRSPEVVAAAPGRVNLIGEHTDYNDGFVFPAAIDRETYIAASPVEGATSATSGSHGDGIGFDARTVEPGYAQEGAGRAGWTKYLAGMTWAFREAGHPVTNVQAAVISNVPTGSGVSSSAALEMAFAVVLTALGGYELAAPVRARIGQRCENGFVGVQSGIMDQMASACARARTAMFLDTRSLELEHASINRRWTIALLDTGKKRSLDGSAYNERRAQCEAAARHFGVAKLRDVDLATLEAAQPHLDPVVFRRARHVITENARTLAFRDALNLGNALRAGTLMAASHESLRDDYEVSCPELDLMVEIARQAPGAIGVRMTGAGFGGACVALVETEMVDKFLSHVRISYDDAVAQLPPYAHAADALPPKSLTIACQPSAGARLIGIP